jgi:predicted transcriptional regulator of viral defense system
MYEKFRQAFGTFVVISLKEIFKVFPDFDTKNLVNWQKKGYVIRLRNQYYMLSESKIDEDCLFYVSNKIYSPSYVSMESALDFYGVIPEGVYSIQGVSTRKTNTFSSKLGLFNYQSIRKELYFGYQLVKQGSATFRIASLEKGVLDFLYLRSDIDDYDSFEALRWNKDVLFKWMKLNFRIT